jgi:hypothetical protein
LPPDAGAVRGVLARYPELAAGLPEHADEVVRLAGRILVLEANPSRPPILPADAPAWERAYWRNLRVELKATRS